MRKLELGELIKSAKLGDEKAKEEILNRFTPLIIKYSRSTYICGYQEDDLIQIGYNSILDALKVIDINRNNSFVAYISAAVIHNYYCLIRSKCRCNAETSLNKPIGEGIELMDELEAKGNIEETLLQNEDLGELNEKLNMLSSMESELIDFIYFKERTLKEYSKVKGISYSACAKRKERIIKKLRKALLGHNLNQTT